MIECEKRQFEKGVFKKQMITLSSIKAKADIYYTFRFLDTIFTIGTNKKSCLIYFKKMYANFRIKALRGKYQPGAYYVIDDPSLSEKPFIWVEDTIFPCSKSEMLPAYAHSIIINSIMAKIKSYLLFHAAAVSKDNQGIIILGSSGQGKSTLTLELIQQGFSFFTDEITCLNRKNYFIYPFPRTIGMKENGLSLFEALDEFNIESLPMISGEKKYIMQVGEIPGIELSDPCLPRFLINISPEVFKTKSNKKTNSRQKIASNITYLAVDNFEDTLMRDLKSSIPEIKKVEKIHNESSPVIRIISKPNSFIRPQLENFFQQSQVALFDIGKEEKKDIDYSQKPSLYKIPKSTALMELLRSFRAGPKSLILQGAKGNIASLTIELCQILKNVQCFNIMPGKLEDMTNLIEEAVNNG